ncbi:hypothetical protein H5T57_02580 [Candidatus Bipolaricaulota bacterium]|nr:hypothetical protein [Candidatus Bipolaricaulota bacterium]
MIKEFECDGIWWLPDKPDGVPGTLRFTSDKGAILELNGSLRGLEKLKEPEEIILGSSNDGKEITLYKCFEDTFSSFDVKYVFIGAHFQKPEDIKFKNASVRYLHLEEWANPLDEKINEKERIIKYRLEPFQADINDELKISINFRSEYHYSRVERCIKHKATEIGIETFKAKSFEYYRKIIRHLRNFLSLGIGGPTYPLTITGSTEVNKEKKVKVFYKVPQDIIGYTPLPRDMLFTFEDISKEFEHVMRRWFEKMGEPAYNLYCMTLYNPSMDFEDEFLTLTKAIEAFHRSISDRKDRYEPEKYKKLRDKLEDVIKKENISANLRNRLIHHLEYGNQFSLRKRLKQIFDIFKERSINIEDRFIKDKYKNKDEFIDKAVNTRNYLTHYDKSIKKDKRETTGKGFYHLIQKLKICLETCFLIEELGFEPEKVEESIFRRWESIRRQWLPFSYPTF